MIKVILPVVWLYLSFIASTTVLAQYSDRVMQTGNYAKPVNNGELLNAFKPQEPNIEPKPGASIINIEGVTAYGYLAWDPQGASTIGPSIFDLDIPSSITNLATTTVPGHLASGSWANGVWYGTEYATGDLYSIDEQTGVQTFIGPSGITDDYFSGIAYDNTSGTMYGISASSLYYIDLATGSSTLISEVPNSLYGFISLACDASGNLYATNIADDKLYSIDKTNGEGTIIGPLGINTNSAQDLEFDNDNNILYLAGFTIDNYGELFTINPATGLATSIGAFENSAEVTGFAIPYTPFQFGNDLSVQAIVSPVTGFDLSSSEQVTVVVKNLGTNTVSSFDVSYEVPGIGIFSENIVTTISTGEAYTYTFTTSVDLSTMGLYSLECCVALSGDENPSNDCLTKEVVNFGLNLCTPEYNDGCSNGYGLVDFAVEEIQNYGSGCYANQGTGWSQYFGMNPAVLNAGLSYDFKISTGGTQQEFVTIWIDFNDDQVLSEDEEILSNFGLTVQNWLYIIPVTIPANATPGLHYMRVRTNDNNPSDDPCALYDQGETEDYFVVIEEALGLCVPEYTTGCTGDKNITDFALEEIENYNSGCESLNGTGWSQYFETGTAQLEQGGSFIVNVGSESNSMNFSAWIDFNDDFVFSTDEKVIDNYLYNNPGNIESVPITIAADAILGEHYFRIRNNYSSTADDPCAEYTYGEAEDYKVVIVGEGSYCQPMYYSSCSGGAYTKDFALEEIQNFNSYCEDLNGIGWSQYLELGPATLQQGGIHDFTFGTDYDGFYFSVWIDFNNDYTWTDDEKVISNFEITTAGTYTVPTQIPVDAGLGQHMMRVRNQWTSAVNNPCEFYGSGEAEDYYVNVVESTLLPPVGLDVYVMDNDVFLNWNPPGGDKGPNQPSSKDLIGYNVYRNNESIANTTNLYYDDLDVTPTGIYNYCVAAVYDEGESGCSNIVEAIIGNPNLNPPEFLQAEVIGGVNAQLIWDEPVADKGSDKTGKNSKALTGYNIYRNNDYVANTPDTTYLDEQLMNGTYTYCVTAIYDEGESFCSNEASITIDAVPELCEPFYYTGCISGDNISDFALEQIQNYNSGCEELTSIGWSRYFNLGPAELMEGMSYDMTIASDNTNQYVSVWIDFNDDGDLTADEWVLNNFQIVNGGELYTVELNIPENSNAGIHYMRVRTRQFYVCNDPCLDYGLGETEDYYVNIIDEIVFPPPTNLTATVSGNLTTLNWNSPTGGTGTLLSYNIYRDNALIGNTTETTFNEELFTGGTYEFCVTAVYDIGESDCSNTVTVTIDELLIPQYFDAIVQGADVVCSWDPIGSKDFLGYRVYDYDVDISGLITATEYLDENVTAGTHIYYVKAEYDGGLSDPSDSITIVITDIDEFTVNNVQVFPNPVKDHLFIEANAKIETISLYDSRGNEVLCYVVADSGFEVNTIGYSPGLYFIKVVFGNEVITKLIIINK